MVLEEMWRWVMNIRVLLEWCEMIELGEHVGSGNAGVLTKNERR